MKTTKKLLARQCWNNCKLNCFINLLRLKIIGFWIIKYLNDRMVNWSDFYNCNFSFNFEWGEINKNQSEFNSFTSRHEMLLNVHETTRNHRSQWALVNEFDCKSVRGNRFYDLTRWKYDIVVEGRRRTAAKSFFDVVKDAR